MPEAHGQNDVVIAAAAAAAGRFVAGGYTVVYDGRVQSRSGHGFRDLEAAAHMYREFASAPVDRRHVVTGLGGGADDVSDVLQRIAASSMVWPMP
jgi:hypothetical protein